MSGQTARLIALPTRPSGPAPRTSVFVSPGSYAITGVDPQPPLHPEVSVPLALLSDAQAEVEAQRPEAACAMLTQILERWPSHVPSMLLLGYLKQSGGDGKAARRMYEEIRARQPDCWQAYYNEALLCFSGGDLASGIGLLRDACALAPSEPEPMFRLALALDEAERPREALVWYRRSVELREKFPAAWLRAALIMMKFGSWAEAAEAIERCLDSEEDGASMWYHYAICLLELGEGDRAKAAFEESHKRRHDSAPVLLGLALLAVLDGSLELAAKYERAAEECGEVSAAILYRLALAFQERGNHEQAHHYYRRSLQIDASLALNYFN